MGEEKLDTRDPATCWTGGVIAERQTRLETHIDWQGSKVWYDQARDQISSTLRNGCLYFLAEEED